MAKRPLRFTIASIFVAVATIVSLVMVALAHAQDAVHAATGVAGQIVITPLILAVLAVFGAPVQYLVTNLKWHLRAVGVAVAIAAFIYWVENPVDLVAWRPYLLTSIVSVAAYAGIVLGGGSTVGLGATWLVKKGKLNAESNLVPVDANPTQTTSSKEAS